MVLPQGMIPSDGRDFFTEPQDEGKGPIFSTGEVATVFFGRTWKWLFNHLMSGDCVHPEYPMTIPRDENSNFRKFQLHHLEVISHALFMHGTISLDRFQNSILIIKAIARNHGLMKGEQWLKPRR
jgi:hypothetical protein